MKRIRMSSMLFMLCCVPAFSVQAQTANKPAANAKRAEPTTEQREQMAQQHEKMAACLRSADKTLSACHDEMMAACKGSNEGMCGMMGHQGHMGMGQHPKGLNK